MSEKPSPLQAGLVAALKRRAALDPASAKHVNPAIERLGGEPVQIEDNGLTYVAVKTARVFGREDRRELVEGQIFKRNDDGSLWPLNGEELVAFAERYPDFLKHWSASGEDDE